MAIRSSMIKSLRHVRRNCSKRVYRKAVVAVRHAAVVIVAALAVTAVGKPPRDGWETDDAVHGLCDVYE